MEPLICPDCGRELVVIETDVFRCPGCKLLVEQLSLFPGEENGKECCIMPTEMKIICPYCGYDHDKELKEELDAWISEEPYETECVCGNEILVRTHVTYSFSVSKV